MAGCHTLLICAHPCASVRICGRLFSARNFCAFRGNIVSHGFHRSTQMVGCVCSPTEFTEFTEVWGAVGCVGTAECHTLLHLCKSVLSVGATSQPEGSVRIRANLWEPLLNQKVLCASVPICGRYFSARRFCAFRAFCGRCFSARRFCVFRAFCGIYPCLFCWCSSCSDSR